MTVLIRTLFIVLAMVCQSVSAVEVKRLYEVEVISQSKSLIDKETAIRQALKIVLARILAGENILQDTSVNEVLLNASNYVREFQFSLGGSGNQKNKSRLLRVLFDEHLLIKALRAGKKGLWNEIRPRTLVWLVVEEKSEQNLFEASMMPEIDLALSEASRQKKLPVIFPIQDLDEKRNLSISNVLSAYSERLLEVSSPYDVVSTVAGKLVNKGSCWQAEWTHYFDAKIKQWRSPCSTLNQVALGGFQGLYDNLSIYYAAKPGGLIRKSRQAKVVLK